MYKIRLEYLVLENVQKIYGSMWIQHEELALAKSEAMETSK
jgi:hypothetical protein